jgi:hypothetical protein
LDIWTVDAVPFGKLPLSLRLWDGLEDVGGLLSVPFEVGFALDVEERFEVVDFLWLGMAAVLAEGGGRWEGVLWGVC